MRKRVEQAWRLRWWSILSCTAARALASSLVDKWSGVGADGDLPAAYEVEAEQVSRGFGVIACSSAFSLTALSTNVSRSNLLCKKKKKAPLPHCCNQVWMKIGGQIPCNVIPTCEAFKISYLLGKNTIRKTFWRTILKDQSFRLVHWLSVTLSLRKTSQESINLERKSYLDCSLLCTRGEFGRVTNWLQTLRSWKRWTHQKSTQKYSLRKSDISQRNGKFIFPVADGRIKLPGGDQELETSTLIRDRPIRGGKSR